MSVKRDTVDADFLTATARPETILVADSDRIHCAFVTAMLLSEGYSVVTASGGEEALQRIRTNTIDLVVSAMTLDGMDSLELLRNLRGAEASPPVIVVAPGMTEMDGIYLKGASLLGAARAFMQPLTPTAFLGSVNELLAARQH